MSLLDDIKAEQTGFKRCPVRLLLNELDTPDADALRQALADSSFQGAAISRALSKRGHALSGPAIQNHRRGVCSCG